MKSFLPRSIFCLVAVWLLPNLAAAQAPVRAQWDEITVTATRTPLTLSASTAPVQVIERAQIERSQASSLLELLRGQAGLDLTNYGGPGQMTALHLRGTASGQVLVLVDGVRMASATTGAAALQDLSLEHIERLEIVRGPHSSLYGADAVGGVIQLFTRKAHPGKHYHGLLGVGTHQLRQASAGFTYQGKDRGWIALHSTWLDTDGINACNGSSHLFQGCFVEEPDRDGYRNTSFNLRAGYTLLDDLKIESHILDARSTNQFDGSPFGGNEADNRQHVYGGKLQWNMASQFTLTMQLGRNNDKSSNYYRPLGGKRSPAGLFNTQRDSVSLQGDVIFSAHQQLSLGTDWQKEQVNSDTDYITSNRKNNGLFAEYISQFGVHSLHISARNDDNQQFGKHHTGTLGYGLDLNKGLRFNSSVGTAFRAPTFNDLYYPFGGNPVLKPEESTSINVGITQYKENGHWAFNVYHTVINHAIALDSQFIPYNITKARIRGAELNGFTNLSGLVINAQASYTDPRDHTPNSVNYSHWLPRRARVYGRMDIDKKWEVITMGLSVYANGPRFDNAVNTARLPGYGLLDLRAEYSLNSAWLVQAKIANVLDRQHQTIAWYNQPGREYQVRLRYHSNFGF